MAVRKGRVSRNGRTVVVGRKRYSFPRGCVTIKGPQLRRLAGKDVEALFNRTTLLAVREVRDDRKIPPIIVTCYMMPARIPFDPRILTKIEPIITRSLVASGVLDTKVASQLNTWNRARAAARPRARRK